MTAYLNDTIVLFGLFALVFFAFLFFTLRRPYRVSNSFLLLLSLLLLVPALVSLAVKEPDRLLMISLLVVLVALFLVPILLVWNGIAILKRES